MPDAFIWYHADKNMEPQPGFPRHRTPLRKLYSNHILTGQKNPGALLVIKMEN